MVAQRLTGEEIEELKAQGLPHEILKGPAVARRYDAFLLDDQCVAFLAPRNGFLHADRCLSAMQELAQKRGAEIWEHSPVQQIEPAHAPRTARPRSTGKHQRHRSRRAKEHAALHSTMSSQCTPTAPTTPSTQKAAIGSRALRSSRAISPARAPTA